MDYISDLYDMCETMHKELAELNEKIRNAGGKMSAGDLEVADKVTHAIKSIKATIAMMESEGPSSYDGGGSYDGGSYRGGSYRSGSYDGGSYRGRGRRGAPRDSMGRYSGDGGYSRHGDMAGELRELIKEAPNMEIRHEMERLLDKIEMG